MHCLVDPRKLVTFSLRHPKLDGLFGEFGCEIDDVQQVQPAPALSSAMLPSEPLTLVPYGPHTLAIPTSMVTPELLASLAGGTMRKQQATPTTTDMSNATAQTVHSHNPHQHRESRLRELGKELNMYLRDDQRVLLGQLHREASDADDALHASSAKQRFWDVWYAAAPRNMVDELRMLMQEPPAIAATPISATPAASVECTSAGAATPLKMVGGVSKPASVSGASCSSCEDGDDDEAEHLGKRKRLDDDDKRVVMPRLGASSVTSSVV